jgi:hypothetical protein
MEWYGLDRSDLRLGPVEDSCEHSNEPLGTIKCWGITRVAAQMVDSRELLSSKKLVT